MNSSISRSSALRSSNSKKKTNTGKGRFESILDQRRINLEEQKEKLELAKNKLKEDQKTLDEEMKKLQEQQDLIQEIGADIKGINSQTSILSEDFNCSALRHQMTVLQKTEADLTQQLKIAQQQLDEKTYRLRLYNRNKEDPETIRLLENELNEKAIQFKMIRELLETLQSEILTRENDVILLEFEALQHKKDVDRANQEREMLIRRKRDAELDKRNIIHEIKKNDQIKLDYAEKKKALETMLSNIQSEQDNLSSIEKELDKKENLLKQKQEQLKNMQIELDQIRLKKAQQVVDIKDAIESKKMNEHFATSQAIDIQSEENVNLEIQLDTEEKLARMREHNYEVEKATQNQSYNDKRNKLVDMINSLQNAIAQAETKNVIEAKISEAKKENLDLKNDIEAQEAEIEKIMAQLHSEDEMNKIKLECQNEIKKLSAQEREINKTILDLKGDERELQDEYEDLENLKRNLEVDRNMIEKNDKAYDEMISICQTQLEQAKKNYQIAYKNFSQNEKNK